mmetsp:Transcript_31622/g.71127  ORF Transcript_31622/g.71127 Transcript_31622/m.71127 type:complete len:345 (-) Transcript_31622:135-1169(-)
MATKIQSQEAESMLKPLEEEKEELPPFDPLSGAWEWTPDSMDVWTARGLDEKYHRSDGKNFYVLARKSIPLMNAAWSDQHADNILAGVEDIDQDTPWQNPEPEFTEQDYLAQAEIEQYMASMNLSDGYSEAPYEQTQNVGWNVYDAQYDPMSSQPYLDELSYPVMSFDLNNGYTEFPVQEQWNLPVQAMPFAASGFYPDGLYAGSQPYCEIGMPVGIDENHYMPMPQTQSQVMSRAVRDVTYSKIGNTTENERLPVKTSPNKLNASSLPYSPEKSNAGKGQVLSDELTAFVSSLNLSAAESRGLALALRKQGVSSLQELKDMKWTLTSSLGIDIAVAAVVSERL